MSKFQVREGPPPRRQRRSRHQELIDAAMRLRPGQWIMVASLAQGAALDRLQATYSAIMRRHVRVRHAHQVIVSKVDGGLAIKCEEGDVRFLALTDSEVTSIEKVLEVFLNDRSALARALTRIAASPSPAAATAHDRAALAEGEALEARQLLQRIRAASEDLRVVQRGSQVLGVAFTEVEAKALQASLLQEQHYLYPTVTDVKHAGSVLRDDETRRIPRPLGRVTLSHLDGTAAVQVELRTDAPTVQVGDAIEAFRVQHGVYPTRVLYSPEVDPAVRHQVNAAWGCFDVVEVGGTGLGISFK